MRMCCGRMLTFIRCMRNKLARSSDIGFGGDRWVAVIIIIIIITAIMLMVLSPQVKATARVH